MNASVQPLITDDLFQRQAELEIEMAGLGADKFRSRITKDIEKERGANQNPGSFIVGRAINPLAEAIRSFVKEAYSGRPRPRAIAAKLVKDMDPNVVAYLSARAILNGLMWKGKSSLLGLARVVAQQLEAEARFEQFSKSAPGLYAKISNGLTDDGATERHKMLVLTYAMNKFDIPWDIWSKTDKMHLGIKMIELFCEATPLARMELEQITFKGKFKEQHNVYLSGDTSDWIEQSILSGEKRWPEYMPTLIPPKDWTGLGGGGYHTNAARPLELVRKCRPEQRKLLEKSHLGAVYGGLNAIQRTPWQINQAILDVMQQLVTAKSDVAGLVSGRDLELPNRPPDIDTNPQALREWKWKARDVHNANIQLRRDRKQQNDLIDLAERFRDEPAIYFPHNLDFRGRAYPVPQLLHPQGSDDVKALLRFAEGKPLGKDGIRWLAIHGANTFGIDKVPFDVRVAWVDENVERIERAAMDPLGDLWWTEADKPWCFLAFCFEWAALGDAEETEFRSHLPIALDGSCNGLQHFSAMLLDPIGGAAVNLLPAETPQDIYQVVADRVVDEMRLNPPENEMDVIVDEVADRVITELRLVRPLVGIIVDKGESGGKKKKKGPTAAQIARWSHEWLHFGIDRKITKRPVMVLPYGGTPRSCVKYVQEEVMSRIDKGQPHNFGDELPAAIGFLAGRVWASIGDVVVAARDAMGWLQKTARVVASKNLPIYWTTPSGFVAYQSYMDTSRREIRTKLAGKSIRVIDLGETDQINRSKQATSISPNFVHSLDASSMILTVDQLANYGITSFAMIHDSYGTHACHTTELAALLRDVFIRMYETDPLTQFRDELVNSIGSSLMDELPELPKKGTLNLWSIQNSDFFFA